MGTREYPSKLEERVNHQTSNERRPYECKNRRGITLLSIVGKVLARILIDRIRYEIDCWNSEQAGRVEKQTNKFYSGDSAPRRATKRSTIYPYKKEKETHEWIFSWLAWLAILHVCNHARRRRLTTWRPYASMSAFQGARNCHFKLMSLHFYRPSVKWWHQFKITFLWLITEFFCERLNSR